MQQSFTTNRAGSDASSVSDACKVDISRGERIGRVSSEWFSRPDDERYLSLGALHAAVRARAERAARTVETRVLRVKASRDDAERMALVVPGRDGPVTLTHWSFGQLCGLVEVPLGVAAARSPRRSGFDPPRQERRGLRFAFVTGQQVERASLGRPSRRTGQWQTPSRRSR